MNSRKAVRTFPPWMLVVVVLANFILTNGLIGADHSSEEQIPAGSSEVESYRPLLDESVLIEEAPDGIEGILQDSATLKEAIVDTGALRDLHRRWIDNVAGLDERYGLRLSFDYNALFQHASGADGDNTGGAGEFRATVRWRPWGREGKNPTNIVFQGWNRHGYSDTTPSALGNRVGSLWPTTRGFNDRGSAVNHFYFEQYLADTRFAFRAGWTRVDSMLDVHAMRAQRTFFLNSGVSDNPAVPFPSSALTGLVMIRPAENLKIKLALSEADSRQLRETNASNQFFKEAFVAAQVGWTPKIFASGESLLQAMYWHRNSEFDTGRPDGDGVSMLAQHQGKSNGTAFLRYSYSSSEVTSVEHMVAAGGGMSPIPDGRPDLIGLSFAWGQPSVEGVRDQYMVEAFYRLQLTPEFQLTPSVELIINPSFNDDHDSIVVFGLRSRLVF